MLIKRWSKDQSLAFQESREQERKIGINISKYTNNELLAIQEFTFRMKVILGPIWIQKFLDDVLISIKAEWRNRD